MRNARRWSLAVLGLFVGVGVATAALPADPVALMVKLQGDVRVERAGAEEPLDGAVGLRLQAGDRVVVGEGGKAVVLYRDGKLVQAAAPVTIDAVEESGSSSLFSNTVRTLGQVASTDARTQPNRQGMIRPIAGAPAPIAPRNEIKVLSPRPTFTWFAVPEAEEYLVQIQRQGDDRPAPVRFSAGTDTTWTLPASELALVPGATYTWVVGRAGGGRVAAPQRFTVASASDIAAIESAMNELIAAGIDPAADGLFLAALAYRDVGLMYEARRALEALEAEGAGTGASFWLLKGEVLDATGDVEGAAAAFDRVDRAPGS